MGESNLKNFVIPPNTDKLHTRLSQHGIQKLNVKSPPTTKQEAAPDKTENSYSILRMEDLQICTDYQILIYSTVYNCNGACECIYCKYRYHQIIPITIITEHLQVCKQCPTKIWEAIKSTQKLHKKQQLLTTDGLDMTKLPAYDQLLHKKLKQRLKEPVSKAIGNRINQTITEIQLQILAKCEADVYKSGVQTCDNDPELNDETIESITLQQSKNKRQRTE